MASHVAFTKVQQLYWNPNVNACTINLVQHLDKFLKGMYIRLQLSTTLRLNLDDLNAIKKIKHMKSTSNINI